MQYDLPFRGLILFRRRAVVRLPWGFSGNTLVKQVSHVVYSFYYT